MRHVRAGVPVSPELPEPTLPLPEPGTPPERGPEPPPWPAPDLPGRKVNVPRELPPQEPPAEAPQHRRARAA